MDHHSSIPQIISEEIVKSHPYPSSSRTKAQARIGPGHGALDKGHIQTLCVVDLPASAWGRCVLCFPVGEVGNHLSEFAGTCSFAMLLRAGLAP